ncbi:MAG: metallophosphoesterase, partial [Selenomonadaceae bacterium]|nr:metallophosphoesterase [Selenomonadaceae bacterium]
MKIGIISDTHGHEGRFALAYDKFFSDADMILHAGDVLYHGPRNKMLGDYNPAALAERINNLKMPI